MQVPALRFSSIITKTALAAAALGFVLMCGAPSAKANDWDDLNRRIAYTQLRYHEAVERFGPYSGEAQHWAHERHEAYERLERYRLEHHHD